MNSDTNFYSLSFERFFSLDSHLKSKLFFDNKLILLKSKKSLSSKKIKALCLNFGKLYRNECEDKFFVNNDPSIMRVCNNTDNIKGLFHNFHLNWHNDFAHTPGGFHGTALYNYKGGEKVSTQFIDTQKAYESLNISIKKKYKNCILPHSVSSKAFIKKLSPAETRLLKMKQYKIDGYFSHDCLNGSVFRPLFPAHPKTKKKSVYLSPATLKVNVEAYADILNHCLKYATSFSWNKNDLLLFDNLVLMHSRGAFSGNRELHRCQFNYENC